MSKTVYVGLSGGVDSAVSAALLRSQGYRVVGAFIKIWRPEFYECTWEKDRIDAMRVAVALDIPFREIDLSTEYEREVIKEMTASYESGTTPNPDVSCNERIKFGSFYDWARGDGADLVATGHYARIAEHAGEYTLLRGVDQSKDQSYFLYRIGRDRLSSVLFPVGGMTKSAVRSLADRHALPVAKKHDSQGLCFVGDVGMREFLSRYIEVREGAVLDENGNEIGRHEGAALYTIGQRHGFSTKEAGPFFVSSIDARSNTLTVVRDLRSCARSTASLGRMHWLVDPDLPRTATAQSRYHGAPFDVRVEEMPATSVMFDSPQVISPGQSLVMYDGDVCLGGGIIT